MPPATLLLSSPRYLTVNEEEELRFAVKNEKDSAIRISFRLDGSNTLPVFIDQGGTNIFLTGALRGSEQIERKVKVFIPYDLLGGKASDTLGQSAGLTLWGSINNASSQQIASLPLSTMPVPGARALLGVSFSMLTGVFFWFVKEWWSITKEALEKGR